MVQSVRLTAAACAPGSLPPAPSHWRLLVAPFFCSTPSVCSLLRCVAFSHLQLSQGAGVPTFNDDIQATAAVAVAAVLGGVRVPGVLPLAQQRWLFFGAGQVRMFMTEKLHVAW